MSYGTGGMEGCGEMKDFCEELRSNEEEEEEWVHESGEERCMGEERETVS